MIDILTEQLLQNSLEEMDFDELDKPTYVCYACNYVGEDVFKQNSSKGLWEKQEETLICPVCGEMIT